MIKSNEYEDIINCARPISQNHPRMSRMNRAAQFAPFAALVGYEDSIDEAKRIVDKKILLTNEEKENFKLFKGSFKRKYRNYNCLFY